MIRSCDFFIEIDDWFFDDPAGPALQGTLSGRAMVVDEDDTNYSGVATLDYLWFDGSVIYGEGENQHVFHISTADTDVIDWLMDEFVGWSWVYEQIQEGRNHV